MVKTNRKRQEARDERLKTLPRSERLVKAALIKKKEGRVLDSSEKHALKMTSEYGEIMRLWEVLRNKESAEEKTKEDADVATLKATHYEHKYEIIDKLLKVVTPKFITYIKTPRVSRVVQSMVKYGSPAQLEALATLVEQNFVENADDAFGSFVVSALIRHAPRKFFESILAAMLPHIPQLVSHKFGLRVVHAAYTSRLCSATDRDVMMLGVLKDGAAVMKSWKGYPLLESILHEEKTHQRRLLTHVFNLCDKLVSQKEAVEYPFVQRLVFAFVQCGGKHEVSELCVTLRPHLVNMCQTREGSQLAALTFSLLEPRSRKDVLRGFSERLPELCGGKYGSPVIARLFDYAYDPQLLNKYLVSTVTEHFEEIVGSPFGHLIFLHLLTPREERKYRCLPPTWKSYNLFSLENSAWNTHTWLDAEMQEETVELCSKSAMQTHLTALQPLLQRFIAFISTPEGQRALDRTAGKGRKDAGAASAVAPSAMRYYVGVIAREALHVVNTEPLYRQELKLSTSDVAALERVATAAATRRDRDAAEMDGGNEEEQEKPRKKQRRQESDGSAAAVAPVATKKVKKQSAASSSSSSPPAAAAPMKKKNAPESLVVKGAKSTKGAKQIVKAKRSKKSA